MTKASKLLLSFFLFLGLLIALLLIRALTAPDPLPDISSTPVDIPLDGTEERLAQVLRHQTLSPESDNADLTPFFDLQQDLRTLFPHTHEAASLQMVNDLTHHFQIPGTDPSKPHVLLLAHQDVVPVTDPDRWTHPPFAGVIADGFIWGRGTLDNKHNLMAILEATEHLLATGFRPEHTLHLVFGHDEEIGGYQGAQQVAQDLIDQDIDLIAVYDEGLIISSDLVPGVSTPVALVGITERGITNIEIEARAPGGHASMPPDDLAIIRLSEALQTIHQNPMPASLDGPTATMVDYALPEMNLLYKVLFRNRWLFDPIILSQMAAKPSTNAVIRTTAAPTMLTGSPRHNVLPQRVTANINYRVHPRDSIDDVLTHLQGLFQDNDHIDVRLAGDIRTEPSPLASLHGPAFDALHHALASVYPDARIAPNMLVAFSDSRHFTPLTNDIYRFQPIPLTGDDLERIHGNDERISLDAYHRLITYYATLIRQW